MDLRHFFDGLQSQEETASAFLATLLEYDEAFRRGFLAKARAEPLDNAQRWEVRVEDYRTMVGPMDVTLESDSTFVLIENKITAGAKMAGQLLRYYRGAVAKWPDRRVVALYLAPWPALGADEVAEVENEIEVRRREGRDRTGGVTWDDVRVIIDELPERGGWFASTGMDAVAKAIKREALPPDAQRDVIRRVVEAARRTLQARLPEMTLARWPSIGQEAIYTAKAPVTLFITTAFDVDRETKMLLDVVVDGRIRATIYTNFALSPMGQVSPVLAHEWERLVRAGSVEIGGVDLYTVEGGKLAHSEEWTGTPEQLENRLVERGERVLDFLRPYFVPTAATE
jgi:hypothetical protein